MMRIVILASKFVNLCPDRLMFNRRNAKCHFYAFDLLWLDRDLREEPLIEPKAVLRKLILTQRRSAHINVESALLDDWKGETNC